MLREVTKSSTSCKVFLRTSRSGEDSTRRISMTSSYDKQKQYTSQTLTIVITLLQGSYPVWEQNKKKEHSPNVQENIH